MCLEAIWGINVQTLSCAGYDHNWVLRKADGLRLAATISEPTTGRAMEVWTNQPGLQFYSGNGLNGAMFGKGDIAYQRRGGFCLEPQHFPDSPNQPSFPTTELKPGDTYHGTTLYKFTAR